MRANCLVLILLIGLSSTAQAQTEGDCSTGNCIETKTVQGLTATIMRTTNRSEGYGLVFACVHNTLSAGRWTIRYRDYEDVFSRRGVTRTMLSLDRFKGGAKTTVASPARILDGDVVADEADALVSAIIHEWSDVDGFRLRDEVGGANLSRGFGGALAQVRKRCVGY